MAGQPTDNPLLSGEKLLWTGVPRQGLIFSSADWFAIPFSLVWGGFAFFWNLAVWTTNSPLFFKLFGLPFLVVGVYLIFGRFILDMRRRAATHYAVTNQRVMVSEQDGASIRSLEIDKLPVLDLHEEPGGSGTIRFGSSGLPLQKVAAGSWPQATMSRTGNGLQFFRIDDVRRVYDLIRKTAGEDYKA